MTARLKRQTAADVAREAALDADYACITSSLVIDPSHVRSDGLNECMCRRLVDAIRPHAASKRINLPHVSLRAEHHMPTIGSLIRVYFDRITRSDGDGRRAEVNALVSRVCAELEERKWPDYDTLTLLGYVGQRKQRLTPADLSRLIADCRAARIVLPLMSARDINRKVLRSAAQHGVDPLNWGAHDLGNVSARTLGGWYVYHAAKHAAASARAGGRTPQWYPPELTPVLARLIFAVSNHGEPCIYMGCNMVRIQKALATVRRLAGA